MKSLFLTVILLLILQGVQSQTIQEDVVYMKNGTFLRGRVVEVIPGEKIKLVLNQSDTLRIPLSEIKKMEKEDVPPMDTEKIKLWHYTFIGEVNYATGLVEGLNRYLQLPEDQYSVMLSVFNGVTISPYFQMGIGTALEVWKKRGFLPVYGDFRLNFLKTASSPFLYINTGYAPGWRTGWSGYGYGGAMAGIGVGCKIKIARNMKQILTFAIGYRFQQIRQPLVTSEIKSTIDSHLLSFKAGVMF